MQRHTKHTLLKDTNNRLPKNGVVTNKENVQMKFFIYIQQIYKIYK
jgi:hypothetical protein